jgi:hypothetical protein
MLFPLYFAQCMLSQSFGFSREATPIDDTTERTPAASDVATDLSVRYLVIVARDQRSLYDFLKQRFSADPKVDVILDRRETETRDSVEMRRPARECTERRRHQAFKRDLRFHSVVVTPCYASAASSPAVARHQPERPPGQGSTSMGDVDVAEERQRVTRWIEESQYLIGRIVPVCSTTGIDSAAGQKRRSRRPTAFATSFTSCARRSLTSSPRRSTCVTSR